MKDSLTFEKLRKINKKRCEKYFHKLPEWSEAEWACALAGEVGELCNFIKKRTRLIKSEKHIERINSGKPVIKGLTMEELGIEAKKELGDVQAYLDLLASAMGFRLEDCVREKFNEVSDRVNSKLKL
jgi:NTP pyrophosphatase (non-canonical NTP hydrolase)